MLVKGAQGFMSMGHGTGKGIRWQDLSSLPRSKMAKATTDLNVYTAIYNLSRVWNWVELSCYLVFYVVTDCYPNLTQRWQVGRSWRCPMRKSAIVTWKMRHSARVQKTICVVITAIIAKFTKFHLNIGTSLGHAMQQCSGYYFSHDLMPMDILSQ